MKKIVKKRIAKGIPKHHHAPIGLFATAAVASLAALYVFGQTVHSEFETLSLERDIAHTQEIAKDAALPIVEKAKRPDPNDPDVFRFILPVEVALAKQTALYKESGTFGVGEGVITEAKSEGADIEALADALKVVPAEIPEEQENDAKESAVVYGTWKMVLYDEQSYDVDDGVTVSFGSDICDQMSTLAGHTHASCAKTSKLKGKKDATDSLGNKKCPSDCTIGNSDCALWNERQKDDTFYLYIANYACL